MTANVEYSDSGGWITHPCAAVKLDDDRDPALIDFHFDLRSTKKWLLSEYEDFGNYYVIQFCPWCALRLPEEHEMDVVMLSKACR